MRALRARMGFSGEGSDAEGLPEVQGSVLGRAEEETGSCFTLDFFWHVRIIIPYMGVCGRDCGALGSQGDGEVPFLLRHLTLAIPLRSLRYSHEHGAFALRRREYDHKRVGDESTLFSFLGAA